jgi:hypothetical protein
MGSTPLLIADEVAALVFQAHFVANEIDFVEPKSGFVDGSGGNFGSWWSDASSAQSTSNPSTGVNIVA